MKNKFKIFIPLIVILSLSLISCEDNNTKLLQQKVETISKVTIDDLLKYKDSYIGDNSAVVKIIDKLPANVYNDGFSLQTDKEPYGIIINYKANENLGTEDYYDFWSNKNHNEFLEKNALVFLALIQNADSVEFNVDNIGEESYKYNREELEKKYGEELKNIINDKTSFENFFKM